MSEQDVESAINFIVEERELRAKKQAYDVKHCREIRSVERLHSAKLWISKDLPELVSIEFEKELVAEVLRRHENDTEKALNELTNPELNSMVQLDIESKKRKSSRAGDEHDAFFDYDIDVAQEVDAIPEYLALLDFAVIFMHAA